MTPELIALTRPVSASIAECELTHLSRAPIDVVRAAAQHSAYEAALRLLRVSVIQVGAAPELPDAVFIEDTAIVLDEVAVITRPGADIRRRETDAVAEVLSEYRTVLALDAPATLDGGDVLTMGRTIYVGRSGRTNDEAIARVGAMLGPYGYRVVAVDFAGCLHLKSAVTAVAYDVVLLNPAWVRASAFPGYEIIHVDPSEPHAANGLRVAGAVVFPEHFPLTRTRLEGRGLHVVTVPCDELAKAEGAVTCCCLLFSV
ncbi:MAG: hypothetical protein JWM95_2280 [Gemmatimonadetes bacterium]|nr:hypothetical protein [Gemmatimonadota bacterium]